jgi:N,N'-diacetyllegionaminate synthase
MNKIKLTDQRSVGEGEPCLIIAEIGINHNGDVSIAKKMIDVAKESGADVVKFQTFKAKEFVSNPEATYTYKSQGKSVTESMLKMFERYEFNESQWKELFTYCQKKGILWASTPQNPSDLDFLLSISDVILVKVGSDDLTNLKLMKYYASKNKPMIISAGMAYESEIADAVEMIKPLNKQLAVLHCISSYPAAVEQVNLKKMKTIRDKFNVVVGFSDHTEGTLAASMAVGLGANIVEKHFTLDKNLPGPDHWFSSSPEELKELVDSIRYVEKAMGTEAIVPTEKEMDMRKLARRSIVAAKDIQMGEKILEASLDIKRPGTGLPPKEIDRVINKKAKQDIKKDELITLDKLE